ncbi:MAG: hypothetical protein HY904_09025 [Deltaproteobacteria bacterium]|nr:hypothetical protein [Deltaproteobacteria bacterium]
MKVAYVVDTGFLDELLAMPGKTQRAWRDAARKLLEESKTTQSDFWVTPGVVFEFGTHVAGLPDGNQRRQLAMRLRALVQNEVLRITSAGSPDNAAVRRFLAVLEMFADERAVQGLSLVDAEVIQEARRLAATFQVLGRRVEILSVDRPVQAESPSPCTWPPAAG